MLAFFNFYMVHYDPKVCFTTAFIMTHNHINNKYVLIEKKIRIINRVKRPLLCFLVLVLIH